MTTHLDCDHVSGLIPLENTKHIFCSQEEWKHAHTNDVRYNSAFWEDVDMETLPMQDDSKAPFGKSCDVFHGGSVIAMLTRGYSDIGNDSYNCHS